MQQGQCVLHNPTGRRSGCKIITPASPCERLSAAFVTRAMLHTQPRARETAPAPLHNAGRSQDCDATRSLESGVWISPLNSETKNLERDFIQAGPM